MDYKTAHWISVFGFAFAILALVYTAAVHINYNKFKRMAIEDISRLNEIADKWEQSW